MYALHGWLQLPERTATLRPRPFPCASSMRFLMIPTEPKAQKRFVQELLERCRYLDESGGRLLRKHGQKVPEVVRADLDRQWQALHTAMAQKPLDHALLDTLADPLDRALGEHMGQWRKSPTREYVESILWAVALTLVIRAFVFEAFKIPTGSMIPTLQIHDHLFVNKFLYGLKVPFTRIKLLQFHAPNRGDIIVFEYPYDDDPDSSGKDLIKRVIAVPGDRVRMANNQIVLNGKPIPRKVIAEEADCGQDSAGHHCRIARECLDGTVYTTQHHVPWPGQTYNDNSPDWPTAYTAPMAGPHASIYTQAENKDFPDFVVPPDHLLVMGDNRDNSKDGRFFGLVPFDTIKGKAGVRWFATATAECDFLCKPDLSRMFTLVHETAPGGTCDNF